MTTYTETYFCLGHWEIIFNFGRHLFAGNEDPNSATVAVFDMVLDNICSRELLECWQERAAGEDGLQGRQRVIRVWCSVHSVQYQKEGAKQNVSNIYDIESGF